MQNTLSHFSGFFKKNKWAFSQDKKHSVIHTHFTSEHGRWLCVANMGEKSETPTFYSIFPSLVPVDKRQRCADLLHRINYGLVWGCFEIDMDDGEIRVRTSLSARHSELNPKMINDLVYSNVAIMDHNYGAIMKVIYSEPAAAKEAEVTGTEQNRIMLN